MPRRNMSVAQKTPKLSFRQCQVLRCITKGYNNKVIARSLNIEVVTVKMHVGVLFKKLGVTNRTEAAVRGIELYNGGSTLKIELPEREVFTNRAGDRAM